MGRWTLLLAGLVAACGGRVVVDHETEGSAGGGGAPGASLSDEEICEAYCPKPSVCGEGPVPCADQCFAELASAGACRDLVATWLACYAELHAHDECSSPACTAAIQAAHTCITPAGPCDPEPYVCKIGSDGSCGHTCGGVEYETVCPEKEPLGTEGIGTTCTCHVDGAIVGTCAANVLDPILWGGCCDAYFAETG